MPLRYDDALPTLVRVALEFGVDLSSDDTIVLREASGRLGIAFSSRRRITGLAAALRDRLGAYALTEPVLPAVLFASIKARGPRDIPISMEDGTVEWIRLVDRRIVGADWLSDLAPQAEGAPRLVFGSLKGGVGRSTALAVLAADLAAKGKRVLCVDLDVEAPGLGSMLLKRDTQDDRRPKYGVLDYLVENGLGGIEDEELADFIGVSHFSDGNIKVLPAVGRITDEHPENMIGKLARGLIEDVSGEDRLSVAMQLRQMVDRFTTYNEYDAVLLDARAGLAEVTAGSWLGVGARKLLLFGTNQRQTFDGYRYVLSHLVRTLGIPDPMDDHDWRTRLMFVHSKAPSAGNGRIKFRDHLYEMCAETLYDAESEGESGFVFNFGFDQEGSNIPHDATFISYHPDYDAFAPMDEESVLGKDVYRGPFGDFLKRAWRELGWEREE